MTNPRINQLLLFVGFKKRKLALAIKNLEFIISNTDKTISQYRNAQTTTVPFFLLGLNERLNVTAKSLLHLVKRVESYPNLEYSCGLLLRTAYLDILTLLRGFDLHQSNIEANLPHAQLIQSMEDYCNGIFADGLDVTMNYLMDLRTVGRLSNQELIQRFTAYSIKHSRFINPYTGNGTAKPTLRYNKVPGGGKLFRILSNSSQMRNIAQIYDTYLFYSKYEHYSIESLEAIRQGYDNKIRMIDDAINFLALHNYIICSLMEQFDNCDFTTLQQKEIGDYIIYNVFN